MMIKEIRKNEYIRYTYQIIIGILSLIGLFLFGKYEFQEIPTMFFIIVLLVMTLKFFKREYDEREKLLKLKIQAEAGLFIVVLSPLFFILTNKYFSMVSKPYIWFWISMISLYCLLIGVWGLIKFARE